MKTKAKILSLLLAICLVAGLMPMTALADTPTKAFVKAVFSAAAEKTGADSRICAATVKDENESFVLHYVYSSDCIWNVQLFNRMRDGLAEPYKSLIPVLEEDDNNKKGFLFLSDDQYKDMDLDWADPAAVAEALVPGSGTVTTEENTSSVFPGASTDVIYEYGSDYDEHVVETINEVGESIKRPTGANIIDAIVSVSKGGPYYIVEDGITKECYDVVISLHVSRIFAYTASKHICAAQGDWQHDENEHWKLCTCGAIVDKAAHTGGEATCISKAVCDICGEGYGEINASNHTNLVKTEAKAATYITAGNIEYWHCDGCDKYFSDEAGAHEIALADTVIPPIVYVPNNYAPILAQAQNGAFTVSPGAPLEGSKVTISPKPDEGFELAHISAVDGSGAEVGLLRDDDGSYYFIQPDSRVTITVTFRAVSDVSDCPGDASCLLARFSDVDMHAWYHDGLHYCVENGLMSGMDDNSFAPNGTMTRAMVWTILARLDGVDAEGGAAWYSAAQQWATENGISDGTEPMGEITREQLAAILYRYELYRGRDVSAGAYDGAATYPDYAEVSGYAVAAMDWAVSSGIVNGADGLLAPQAGATRAQAATLLMRFIER